MLLSNRGLSRLSNQQLFPISNLRSYRRPTRPSWLGLTSPIVSQKVRSAIAYGFHRLGISFRHTRSLPLLWQLRPACVLRNHYTRRRYAIQQTEIAGLIKIIQSGLGNDAFSPGHGHSHRRTHRLSDDLSILPPASTLRSGLLLSCSPIHQQNRNPIHYWIPATADLAVDRTLRECQPSLAGRAYNQLQNLANSLHSLHWYSVSVSNETRLNTRSQEAQCCVSALPVA